MASGFIYRLTSVTPESSAATPSTAAASLTHSQLRPYCIIFDKELIIVYSEIAKWFEDPYNTFEVYRLSICTRTFPSDPRVSRHSV